MESERKNIYRLQCFHKYDLDARVEMIHDFFVSCTAQLINALQQEDCIKYEDEGKLIYYFNYYKCWQIAGETEILVFDNSDKRFD